MSWVLKHSTAFRISCPELEKGAKISIKLSSTKLISARKMTSCLTPQIYTLIPQKISLDQIIQNCIYFSPYTAATTFQWYQKEQAENNNNSKRSKHKQWGKAKARDKNKYGRHATVELKIPVRASQPESPTAIPPLLSPCVSEALHFCCLSSSYSHWRASFSDDLQRQ